MSEKAVALVLVFDKLNSSNYLVYYGYRISKAYDSEHYCRTIVSNGITLGAKNNAGTQVVNSTSGSASDIVQYVLYVGRLDT